MTAMNLKCLQAALILLLLGLQSCSLTMKPDLERLYQQNREVRQPPVIVIHGLMGSRLEDTDSGKEIWGRQIPTETLATMPSTNRGTARSQKPRYWHGNHWTLPYLVTSGFHSPWITRFFFANPITT